jgi:hypothetical protein
LGQFPRQQADWNQQSWTRLVRGQWERVDDTASKKRGRASAQSKQPTRNEVERALEGANMKGVFRKTLLLGAVTLTIAVGSPSFALSNRRTHHANAFGYVGRNANTHLQPYARARLPYGYGCGPYADNDDGWGIGAGGVCYYPYYGYPFGYGP